MSEAWPFLFIVTVCRHVTEEVPLPAERQSAGRDSHLGVQRASFGAQNSPRVKPGLEFCSVYHVHFGSPAGHAADSCLSGFVLEDLVLALCCLHMLVFQEDQDGAPNPLKKFYDR